MASKMNHWERVRAAIKGEEVDRVPVSLWRHFPGEDETPQGLAKAMVSWQRQYDFDLVKFMPTGTYGVHDWGAQTVYNPGTRGNRLVTEFGLTERRRMAQTGAPGSKSRIPGQRGRSNPAGRGRTSEQCADSSRPYSAHSTTAVKLAGDKVYADLRLRPELLHAGLQIITDVTIHFARECVRAGAHGVFFATQNATYRTSNEEEFGEFGAHYDLQVLNAIRDETELNMLHVHGEDIMFDVAAEYPVEMINWHDRVTWPSLKEAQERFDGLLVGGINDRATFEGGSVEAIQAQVRRRHRTDRRATLVGRAGLCNLNRYA